jgi:hypothetical protein
MILTIKGNDNKRYNVRLYKGIIFEILYLRYYIRYNG